MFRIYTLYIIAFLFFLTPFYSLFAQCPDSFDDAPVTYGQTTSCKFDSTYFFHIDTSEVAAELTVIYNDPISRESGIIEERDNLPPGRYTVKYRSENGCFFIKIFHFFPLRFMEVADQCSTSLGSAGIEYIFSDERDYSYSWNTGDTVGRITNLSVGSYSLTISETGDNGCAYVAPFEIEDGGIPNVYFWNGRTDCNIANGSLEPFFTEAIGLENDYNYLWSTGDTTLAISGLAAGEYTVTITNQYDTTCQVVDTVTLRQSNRLFVPEPVITNLSCAEEAGSIVFPEEEMEGISAIWSTGDTTISLTGLAVGSYAVTFTDEDGGCTAEKNFYISDNSEIVVGMDIAHAQCGETDGEILLLPPGSAIYHYNWDNGDTTSLRENLMPGDYTVTISNEDRSCSVIRSITIAEIALSNLVEVNNGFVAGHSDSSGTVSVISLVPEISYLWETGDTTPSVENLPIGEYRVTISLPNGQCMEELVVSVLQDCSDFLPDFTARRHHLNNCQNEGWVEFSTENPSIIFVWENGDTVNQTGILPAGNHNYLVIDTVSGCLLERRITIRGSNSVPNINFHATCNSIDSNKLTAYYPNNQSLHRPASFLWSDGQADFNTTFSQIIVEPDSVYTLIVFNSDGCESQFTVVPTDYCDTQELENFALIELGSTSIIPGDTVACIPISIRSNTTPSENLLSYQGNLTYDTSLLEFTEIISEDENLYYGAQETGIIRVVRYELSIVGIPYTDTTLFTACFRPLSEYGIARVEPVNAPLPWEFLNTDSELIRPSFTPGYIDLGNSEVWPGDANRNGTVNHFDLLSVGLANAITGPQRPAATTTWQEETVTSWSDFVPSTDINAAHTDTDGNGTVEKIDQAAIDDNWTFTTPWYNPLFDYDINYPIQSVAAVPLFIHPDTVATNSEANFEIHLGTEAYQAQQIYGLAFSISYDDIVINGDQNISLDFSDGWLGTFQEDLIATYRVFPDEQRIDVGITRIDGQSLDGHGKIGVLSVTIEDVIFRNVMRPFDFQLSGQRIVNANSASLPSNAMGTTSFLERPSSSENQESIFAGLEVFPNPTRDRIWFNNHEELSVDEIRIYHQSGILAKTIQVNGLLPRFVELNELPAGVYLLTLRGADRVHSLKVVKW